MIRRVAIAATLCLCAPARAGVTLLEGEDHSLTLGGYARSFAAVQRLEIQDTDPLEIGLSATVLRAEWKLRVGDVSVDVHQRGYLQITTASEGLGLGGVGVGVSVPPGRTVDLSTTVLDRPDLVFNHDVDRLAVSVWLDAVDLTLGRQAVTWGTANLFPVADLWTTFSPFELDTSQKRGVDAVRAIWGLFGGDGELDLIVADRGSLEDLSGGGRLVVYTPVADVFVAVSKLWNELFVFAGVSAEAGSFKLRADAALPYHLDDAELQLPRATLGIDWLRPNLVVSFEGHYNGAGAGPDDAYLAFAAGSQTLARGETYLLGRWYAGAVVSWTPTEPVSLVGTTLVNLRDPSAMVALAVSYAPTQAVSLSLGTYQGLGARPALVPVPELPSEFGAYGQLYYVELAAYF